MKVEFFLAWRYLFRGKKRYISFISLISAIGITLGVATLIVVISVMNGFDKELTDRLMRFNFNLIVEGSEDNLKLIKKEVEKWEETEVASLFLQTQVFARLENYILPLAVRGIDLTDEKEKSLFYRYIKEEWGKDGFFIGDSLRKRFFLKETIKFYPLTKKLKLKEESLRGVFKVGIYDIDNNYLIGDLEKVRKLGPNYLISLGIKIKNPWKAEEFKEKLKKKFPPALVNTWIETNSSLFSALKLEKATMFLILSLIIIVASFNIFATLTVKVVEKTKDIGILKSLGFTKRKIWTVFSLQGLILGFLGVSIGSIIGIALCIGLEKYSFKLPPQIYFLDTLPVYYNYGDIFLIGLVGIVLSFISSLLPALRASRISPAKALRYE